MKTDFGSSARLAENRPFLAAVVLFLALLAYGNTVFHQFAFDDQSTIESSPLLKSEHFWRLLFSSDYFWMSGESTFRPLVTLSYRMEHRLFGGWAGGYHAVNVALHVLNVFLLFWIAAPWFPRPAWGAVAAGILAIHTAGAEAVNGISFREDLLVATFVLGAWLALRHGAGRQRMRAAGLIGAAACYLAACLSKESGLVFVALAALGMRTGLLSKNPGQRFSLRRSLAALNWLLPPLLLFLWIWGWWMANPTGRPHAYLGGSQLVAVYNVPAVYAHHVRRLVWPADFRADYQFEARHDVCGVPVQTAMALFILALCAIAFLVERVPKVGFGLAWMVITLLPVSNVVPLFNPVADRYLYFPLIGFAVSVAAMGQALWRRSARWREGLALSARRAILVGGLGALLALLRQTTERNLVWGSDERLWSETILRAPDSWRALYRLGEYYREQAVLTTSLDTAEQREQFLSRAEQFLRKAKSLAPHHADIRNALGHVFMAEGRVDEAIKEYRVSTYLFPRNPTANINLCQAYANRQPPNYDLAAYYLRQAIRCGFNADPAYVERILSLRRQSHAGPASQKTTEK